ncbi:MAG: unnamed protein product [uncultured Paraburkholderia sp.]|nr:MAG: unnamed protein product [uncultured Paraburkholderia sp.]CAH2912577.1 MAG: hypothetical protein PPHERAN_0845 [uncultured Paraburkholderia sp.]CAH2915393.1 MAG: unnamed protein product [uncultured Paraburkholderia sp.]
MRRLLLVQIRERDPLAVCGEIAGRFFDSVLLPTPPFGFATTITVMNTPGKKAGDASRFAAFYLVFRQLVCIALAASGDAPLSCRRAGLLHLESARRSSR